MLKSSPQVFYVEEKLDYNIQTIETEYVMFAITLSMQLLSDYCIK